MDARLKAGWITEADLHPPGSEETEEEPAAVEAAAG